MKKLFLMALLVVGITTFAQEPGGNRKERLTPEQRVNFQVKKMTKDLNLNDKQAEQVKALVAKQVATRDAKRSEREANKEQSIKPSKDDLKAMKAKMQEDQNAMKEEMKKILTADQYTKWEQQMAERKDKMMERMKDRKENKAQPQENGN